MMNKLQAFGLIVSQAVRGELTFPTSVNSALQLQLALFSRVPLFRLV